MPDQPPEAALGELRAQVAELRTANTRLHEVIEAKGAQLAAAQAALEAAEARFAALSKRVAELERRLGKEARPVILGHVQRGGTPTAYDRVLATRFGWHAVEAVHAGAFGMMTALRGTEITLVPLARAVEELKTVPWERYSEAECVL